MTVYSSIGSTKQSIYATTYITIGQDTREDVGLYNLWPEYGTVNTHITYYEITKIIT